MLCTTCDGRGTVREPHRPGIGAHRIPCPECFGSGVTHCCDGDAVTHREALIDRHRAPDPLDRFLEECRSGHWVELAPGQARRLADLIEARTRAT